MRRKEQQFQAERRTNGGGGGERRKERRKLNLRRIQLLCPQRYCRHATLLVKPSDLTQRTTPVNCYDVPGSSFKQAA